MITINRSKAEEKVRERLRLEREPRLAALDVAYMRALETGQDVSVIVARKQALRDVTEKNLDALTIEQLAALSLESALVLP
ncbi:hypothetical protein UIA24_19180 [Pseudomonas sp. AL 58]|uniref:hypothetical protein n=1 Tax=Pseudomonas sp. AL 58 TaxID=3104275 RepID=UPI002EA7EFB2|nr:hypothetical protein [Pseudomonas sp. AL 58]